MQGLICKYQGLICKETLVLFLLINLFYKILLYSLAALTRCKLNEPPKFHPNMHAGNQSKAHQCFEPCVTLTSRRKAVMPNYKDAFYKPS